MKKPKKETAAGRLPKRNGGKKTAAAAMRKDYSIYRFSTRQFLGYLTMYLLLDLSVSYLFFYSWIAFVLLLPGAAMFMREKRKQLQKRRSRRMLGQFLDGLQMTAASLQAGYSIENAISEASRDLRRVYEPEDYIVLEFSMLEGQIRLNRSLEELLLDLGRRSAVEDIKSFAEVFLTARRSGGDLLAVIRNTTSCIRQKQETLQEIETCLAGKAMEQNIMSLIPILILAYVKLTSPEFLSSMYGNVTGTAIMSICFLVYAAAYFWGKKIVQIEV